jgi:hypothetical protein
MAVRKAKIQQQVLQKFAEVAPPGEQVTVFFEAITGPSPWLIELLDEIPLVGLISVLVRDLYFVALTNTSVVVVGANKFTNRPTNLVAAEPFSTAQFSKLNIAAVWSKVYYQMPGRSKPTRLNVHRRWRKELDALVRSLGPSLGGGIPAQADASRQEQPGS